MISDVLLMNSWAASGQWSMVNCPVEAAQAPSKHLNGHVDVVTLYMSL